MSFLFILLINFLIFPFIYFLNCRGIIRITRKHIRWRALQNQLAVFRTTMVILIWEFFMFHQFFPSPQVKWSLIITDKPDICALPQELPNDLRNDQTTYCRQFSLKSIIIWIPFTAWKMSKYGAFFGLYFPITS